MCEVADRPWDLAALVPSAKTILITTLLLALSFGVFTLISVEDAACTFSAALTRGNCWSSGVPWRPPAGAISRRGGRSTTMSVAMVTDVADFLGRIAV